MATSRKLVEHDPIEQGFLCRLDERVNRHVVSRIFEPVRLLLAKTKLEADSSMQIVSTKDPPICTSCILTKKLKTCNKSHQEKTIRRQAAHRYVLRPEPLSVLLQNLRQTWIEIIFCYDPRFSRYTNQPQALFGRSKPKQITSQKKT